MRYRNLQAECHGTYDGSVSLQATDPCTPKPVHETKSSRGVHRQGIRIHNVWLATTVCL